MTTANNQRLSGINPTAYFGVNPASPLPLYISDVAPTSDNFENFSIGTLWLVPGTGMTPSSNSELWILAAISKITATWVQLYPGTGSGGGANTYVCNTGVANQSSGAISVLGGTGISTTGSGSTITINLTDTSSQSFPTDSGTATPSLGVLNVHGGTNIQTSGSGNTLRISTTPNVTISGDLTVDGTYNAIGSVVLDDPVTLEGSVTIPGLGQGVVQAHTGGSLFSTEGTNGQVLIASSSGAPAWNNLTSTDGSITITNGAHTIDLASHGSGGSLVSSSYFLAYQSANLSINVPVTNFPIGSLGGAPGILTISRNPGSHFFPGNGSTLGATYTAPATGTYVFIFQVTWFVLSFQPTVVWNYIDTPAHRYTGFGIPAFQIPRTPSTVRDGTICAYANYTVPLTLGDVVNFTVANPGGSFSGGGNASTIFGINPAGIGLAPSGLFTFISGYRIA